jgi:hypothetical protein
MFIEKRDERVMKSLKKHKNPKELEPQNIYDITNVTSIDRAYKRSSLFLLAATTGVSVTAVVASKSIGGLMVPFFMSAGIGIAGGSLLLKDYNRIATPKEEKNAEEYMDLLKQILVDLQEASTEDRVNFFKVVPAFLVVELWKVATEKQKRRSVKKRICCPKAKHWKEG